MTFYCPSIKQRGNRGPDFAFNLSGLAPRIGLGRNSNHNRMINTLFSRIRNTILRSGKVIIDFSGNSYDDGYSLQLDNIGNIYIAGLSNENDDDFAVIKLDTNGDLDPSFGAGGKVIIDFSGNSDDVARSLQLDDIGNIYVAGSSEVNGNRDDFAVIKLDTNGDLDPSFGANGKVIIDFSGNSGDEGYSLQLDKLGNIYVAGSSYLNGSHDFAVIKLKPNGNLDNTFGKIIE